MFPLNIRQDLPIAQQATLSSIALTTPIHVHTPVAHIGMVHSDSPGERVKAIETIHCLRVAYNQMNRRMIVQAEISFAQTLSSSDTRYQSQLTSVQRLGGGPVGYDLLLEHDDVWGLEPISFEGYCVVHLA